MSDKLSETFGEMKPHMGVGITKTHRTEPTEIINPKNNTLPSGYVVAVTGSAQGIGQYIARNFVLAKVSGVIITARRAPTLEKTKAELEQLAKDNGSEIKVSTLTGDAEKYETYVALRELVEKEHGGRLDALVCNAGPGNGGAESWHPQVANTPVDDWHSMLGVNVNGPFFAAKELIPLLLKSEGKTLVNIVSGAAHFIQGPPPAYCLAKFAESRLTQIIGEAYAKEGLVAVALHPGAVVTPSSTSQMPEEMHGILTDSIELAGSISVWLTKNRPEWLSGRYMSVNWDIDEIVERKDEILAEDKFKFRMAV